MTRGTLKTVVTMRGGSALRPDPLPFHIEKIPFRIPSIDEWNPSHIPSKNTASHLTTLNAPSL